MHQSIKSSRSRKHINVYIGYPKFNCKKATSLENISQEIHSENIYWLELYGMAGFSINMVTKFLRHR
jgi:hypothetical protein